MDLDSTASSILNETKIREKLLSDIDCKHKSMNKFIIITGLLLKFIELALGFVSTYYLYQVVYLYFNRLGDIFIMVGIIGGLLAAWCLLILYFDVKSLCAQMLLLLVYGLLNTIVGTMFVMENINHKFCKEHFILAMLVLANGILMLFDFMRTHQCWSALKTMHDYDPCQCKVKRSKDSAKSGSRCSFRDSCKKRMSEIYINTYNSCG